MKKTLLIALLLIPFLGISQTTKPIDGFLGIKFGSSKKDVITAIKAKGGVLDDNPAGDDLNFSNVKLGHRTSSRLEVRFLDDKVYFSAFAFKADNDPETFDYYHNLVNDIADIYGAGTSIRKFKSPFKDGDGNELESVEGGYADIYCFWVSDKKRIELSINANLSIVLIYQDDVLVNEATSRQKAKEKSDY